MASKAESVWDYPRPPRLESTAHRIRIVHAAVTIADTRKALRVLETSHPPVYYISPDDLAVEHLVRSRRNGSYCEFKGMATYWSVVAGQNIVSIDAAWSYEEPAPAYRALRKYLVLYGRGILHCYVDDEQVIAQQGDFYGGWITSHVTGPFKGPPGTLAW